MMMALPQYTRWAASWKTCRQGAGDSAGRLTLPPPVPQLSRLAPARMPRATRTRSTQLRKGLGCSSWQRPAPSPPAPSTRTVDEGSLHPPPPLTRPWRTSLCSAALGSQDIRMAHRQTTAPGGRARVRPWHWAVLTPTTTAKCLRAQHQNTPTSSQQTASSGPSSNTNNVSFPLLTLSLTPSPSDIGSKGTGSLPSVSATNLSQRVHIPSPCSQSACSRLEV